MDKIAMTFKPIFTITNRIAAGLTRIERVRGFLEAATLSETWLKEMGRRALILEAHHTTHIEGTRLTLEQAERYEGGRLNLRQSCDTTYDKLMRRLAHVPEVR